ncbi:DUF1697 domain-containing protein [Marinilactibacillus piezotolerans]|uniref:DUF1697 domain-containing protein n=1 Tax=Marinilactibacillus piezotolerans TaxID=258723 RepID=UPI00117D692D|nr:DUF1697 domain-containing protein [Marinilactibacillus piezotolerans]
MIYIALLRGINVGGKNKIKMAALREALTALDLKQVQTYIQTGNIVFESALSSAELIPLIEQKLSAAFDFSAQVLLRTAPDLQAVYQHIPFSDNELSKAQESAVGESLYVAFLSAPLSEVAVLSLESYKQDSEEYHVDGAHVYFLFYESIRNSKSANHLQKLDPAATIRNWKTVTKLVSMTEEPNNN